MADNYIDRQFEAFRARQAKREAEHRLRLKRFRMRYIKQLKNDNNQQPS